MIQIIIDNNVVIALGANMFADRTSPIDVFHAAFEMLQDKGIRTKCISKFYRTPCFPAGSGPDYINACASLTCQIGPEDLLQHLHDVEEKLGRKRIKRWDSRIIDLDLLFMDNFVRPDAQTLLHWINLPPDQQQEVAPQQLILPHPRLQDRAFVLVPLMDVAPNWRHPVLKKTVKQLFEAMPKAEIESIVAL